MWIYKITEKKKNERENIWGIFWTKFSSDLLFFFLFFFLFGNYLNYFFYCLFGNVVERVEGLSFRPPFCVLRVLFFIS